MTALFVFLAALAPMTTVTGLRRLLVEQHGAGPAAMHAFVAVGMLGAAVGAPLVAARADRARDPARLALILAAIDVLVTAATASRIPLPLAFALRLVHGAVSMGLLAVLFAGARARSRAAVARAGAAMVAALAVGPALGGALLRFGPTAPFRAASVVGATLVVAMIVAPSGVLGREAGPEARPPRAWLPTRDLVAPLLMTMLQRFAIGGLVVAFAVHARAVHGFADATVGACFSLVLVVFAVAMLPFARGRRTSLLSAALPAGGVLFGLAFVSLAVAPRWAVPVSLAAAGVGAAMVYGPALAFTAAFAPAGRSATTMALLHSAGAVGMVLGPAAAACLELAMRGQSPSARAASFLVLAGGLQLASVLALSPSFRALARRAAAPIDAPTAEVLR